MKRHVAGPWIDACIVAACGLASLAWIADRRHEHAGAGRSHIDIAAATARSLSGETIPLSRWAGRALLLNVWAPWCAPCHVETPELVALQRDFGDRLVVIGLTAEAPIDDITAFVARYDITYPILLATRRTADALPPVSGLPTSFLVGPDGTIQHTYVGVPDMNTLRADITRLLAASQ